MPDGIDRPAIKRYLERHAEPGSLALAESIDGAFDATVVVPARDESIALLAGLAPALCGRDVLVIIVVNGDPEDESSVTQANVALLTALRAAGEVTAVQPGAEMVCSPHAQLLVIDRASPSRLLPTRQGVGRARRIGCDVALALWYLGVTRRSFIDTTDADVVLPADYFDQAPPDAVAIARRFTHVPCGDNRIDAATQLYEMTLRYYVAGLSQAGSAWAMHTIGSCMSVRASGYAAVRGLPVRPAGEDFYLMAKIAKLGRVAVAGAAPIELSCRASLRVPFGTGRGALAIARTLSAGDVPCVYSPASFSALSSVLVALAAWCEAPDLDPDLSALEHNRDPVLVAAVGDLKLVAGVKAAVRGANAAPQRHRRVREWLDAFRTLKLIHALRANGHAPVPWPQAVAALLGVPVTGVVDALSALTRCHEQGPNAGVAR